jgi:hypothetical protein
MYKPLNIARVVILIHRQVPEADKEKISLYVEKHAYKPYSMFTVYEMARKIEGQLVGAGQI